MRIDRTLSLAMMLSLSCGGLASAQENDIQALRTAVEELRADYETRIGELERRLAVAEQNARQANAAAQQPAAAPGATANQSAFNPAIGVIFSGTAWNHSRDPDDNAIPGYPFGGEAGPIEEGLALGETEIDMSASVDDKFTAWLTLPIAIEDGEAHAEIEEAWLETTALPAGLSLRFGRFFSGIGYLNGKHLHTWDFADQPLPYQAFLGDQYIDDGLQLRWIAPTSVYLELGSEVLRGARYPGAGAAHAGFGSYSLFANVGGDAGSDSSWLAGVSYLDTEARGRPAGPEDEPVLFTGGSSVAAAHFVWKWAPQGNWKQRNLVLQSELLWKRDDGAYELPGSAALDYDSEQFGWYAQAIYQPFPRWRFGTRIDGLSADDPGAAFAGTPLAVPEDDPLRFSLMMDWSNSEFSRLRLQYTKDEASRNSGHQWGLQYIYSIGAHGAHTF
ncbi:MAG TPA: hypothetical protein VFE85_05115 [Woeseiaceae bacterium]|nr:hypothetical protein [Woeseiaceae bacterium]